MSPSTVEMLQNSAVNVNDWFKTQSADSALAAGGGGSPSNSADSPYFVVRRLQQTFTRTPSLREQIVHPQTEAQKHLAREFSSTASAVLGSYMCDYYLPDLLKTGHISLDRLLKMHNIDCFCDPSGDYSELIKDLSEICPEDKLHLRTNRNYFVRLFGFMDRKNQESILKAVE